MAYDKVIDSAVLDGAMTATADAIREKAGSSDKIAWDEAEGFKAAVETIQTGYAAVEEKAVSFWDYDGTLLYSYSLEEAQALEGLPPLPDREGLICQGWNWTLEEVRAVTDFADIGAMYITDDGATRLHLDISGVTTTVDLHFSQSIAGGVVVNWGDGSDNETVDASGDVDITHRYEVGVYTVSLLPADGCTLTLGGGTSRSVIGGSNSGRTWPLAEVQIGERVVLESHAFYCATQLRAVAMPDYITGLASSLFNNATRLGFLTIPVAAAMLGVTDYAVGILRVAARPQMGAGSGALANAQMLKRVAVTLTGNVPVNFMSSCHGVREAAIKGEYSTIGQNAYNGCRSLVELDLPDTVTAISALAFNGCTGLQRLRFRSATPPTVANANAFTGIPADCAVEVLAESLAEYQAATNYASIAAQMVGVESFD